MAVLGRGRGRALTRPCDAPARWAAVALAALGLWRFWRMGAAPWGLLEWASADDAFYYLEIALRIGAGEGSTFDGIHPTNGYHPGWMAMLVPLAVAWSDPEPFLRAAGLLFGALWTGTGIGLLLLCRARGALLPGIAAATLWIASPVIDVCLLLESAAGACFAVAAVALATARDGAVWRGTAGRLALGAALGVAVLARLDHVLLVPAVLVVHALRSRAAWSSRWRPELAKHATVLLGAAALVAPYLTWNVARFGSWMPVSGAIKRSSGLLDVTRAGGYGSAGHVRHALTELGAALDAAAWPGTMPLERSDSLLPVACVALLVLVSVACAVAAARRDGPTERDPALAIHVFALAHLVLYTLVGYATPSPWYWVPEWLSLCLLVGRALEAVERGARRIPVLLLARGGTLALVVALWVQTLETSGRYRDGGELGAMKLAAVAEVDAIVPVGGRIGSWNAGELGFLSARPVVNLDGLVNAPGFQQLVTEIGWEAYARREGIGWIVDFPETFELHPDFAARLEPVADIPFPVYSSISVRRLP